MAEKKYTRRPKTPEEQKWEREIKSNSSIWRKRKIMIQNYFTITTVFIINMTMIIRYFLIASNVLPDETPFDIKNFSTFWFIDWLAIVMNGELIVEKWALLKAEKVNVVSTVKSAKELVKEEKEGGK